MSTPRVTNMPTWAIVTILAASSGGVGVVGGRLGQADQRPNPYTSLDAKRDLDRINVRIEHIEEMLENCSKRFDALEEVVRNHNADAWEWKAKITDCQRQQSRGT